ncbi:uncharacterized protein LOC117413679 [Acipenser ruthenus]|uniref:uncharacterized protein LOC117413679 n=1 Tax=Acipenser ruthenus TaxID=7906 RepID=UPI0027428B47|nr:uncharacterized protein LOC117413679 [Acipenser ruthenus]
MDFCEIETADDENSHLVMTIVFNPVTDELITGGLDGIKFWKYRKKPINRFSKIAAMSDYGLFLRAEQIHISGGWCTNIDLDVPMQQLYCCSDRSLFCYDMGGNQLLHLTKAHKSNILSCIYCPYIKVLITSSIDLKIKAWSRQGFLIHVFLGHRRPVTSLLRHPETESLFLSGSLDGTVRFWSLDTMEQLYCLAVFEEGIQELGLTEDKLLYCWSTRGIHLYNLNHFVEFWSPLHYQVSSLSLCRAKSKTTRVLALGDANSIQILSRLDGTKLCIVPPPPFVSPIQKAPNFVYSRESGIVVVLLSSWEVWVYTARTDPACRVAFWDIRDLQHQAEVYERKHAKLVERKKSILHCTVNVSYGKSLMWECSAVGCLSSPVCYLSDEGIVCPDTQEFILCGMQDGRILFMDITVLNLKYCELKAHKDPVVSLMHDIDHNQLLNTCQELHNKLVQIWSLPFLELLHQVPLCNDVTAFTRMMGSLFLGHKSGAVAIVDILINRGFPEQERRPHPGHKEDKPNDENDDTSFKQEHRGPVLSVDSCPSLSLFMSCGSDYTIKLWDFQKTLVLVADVHLDDSLTSACFLNSSGDILVAFKNHLFLLPHHKLMHVNLIDDIASETSAQESFIYEDPSLKHDYRKRDQETDILDMESYLVPYKRYDLTECSLEETDDTTSQFSSGRVPYAASATYQSPQDSQASISEFLITPGSSSMDLQELLLMYEQMRLSPRPGHPGESVLDKLQIGISPERLSPTPIPPKEPETEEQAPQDKPKPLPEDLKEEPKAKAPRVKQKAPEPQVEKEHVSRFSNIKTGFSSKLPMLDLGDKRTETQVTTRETGYIEISMEKSVPTKTRKETTLDSKVRGCQGAKRKSRKITTGKPEILSKSTKAELRSLPVGEKAIYQLDKQLDVNIPKHNELPVHGLLYDTETAVPEPNDVSETKKYAKQKRILKNVSSGRVEQEFVLLEGAQHRLGTDDIQVEDKMQRHWQSEKKTEEVHRPQELKRLSSERKVPFVIKQDAFEHYKCWIDRELERHECSRLRKNERNQRVHLNRGILEMKRLQHWQSQSYHWDCMPSHTSPHNVPFCSASSSESLTVKESAGFRTSKTPPRGISCPPLSEPLSPLSQSHSRVRLPYRATGEEHPFRLNQISVSSKDVIKKNRERKAAADLFDNDSARGLLLLKRRQSRPSVLSKRRYVLLKIKSDTPDISLPTAFEERLLMDRFTNHRGVSRQSSTQP